MVRFHETRLGQKHYERDFPALVTELRELNGSLQQILSLQTDAMDMAARALVKAAPKQDLEKLIKYEYRLDVDKPITTVIFSNHEEFMEHISEVVSKKFESDLHFSKWMYKSGFAYTSIVYYAP